jgi:hypothetical protein
MTMVPNPRRSGGDTGGPSRSVQLMVKVSPSDELLHVAVDEHDVAALRQAERRLGLMLELGEVALAQRQRGSQRLQSLDLAYDLAVNVRRQSTCFNRQVFPNLAELHIGDAKSRVCAEQQERRNDRASEDDQQVPQRPGLAERGHCSDPQENPAGDAKQATAVGSGGE